MSEAQKKECRCNCGYRCGGPGKCKLGVFECLQKTDGKHFVRDCEHKFTGWKQSPDGGTTVCECGVTAAGHDMVSGP